MDGLAASTPDSLAAVMMITLARRDEARARVGVLPFVVVWLPNDDVAIAIAQRSVSVMSVGELWGHGASYSQLLASVEALPAAVQAPTAGNVRGPARAALHTPQHMCGLCCVM